jgi:hypothetical protein
MFRVVFKSVNPRTQLLERECGPWLPHKEDADRWAIYFNTLGHHAHATVENGSDKELHNHTHS